MGALSSTRTSLSAKRTEVVLHSMHSHNNADDAAKKNNVLNVKIKITETLFD